MALEKIEENFSLLVTFRDGLNYYFSYVEERMRERKTSITGLSAIATQVAQMSQKSAQVANELAALEAERDKIEQELGSLFPHKELVMKIESIESEILERQRSLREKADLVKAQEVLLQGNLDDKLAQEKLHQAQATLRGEQVGEDFVIERLVADLTWYKEKLEEAGTDSKEVKRQSDAVKRRADKIAQTVLTKKQNLETVDSFVQTNQKEIDRLAALKEDLSILETKRSNIIELLSIASEVPLHVPTEPAPAAESVPAAEPSG